MNEYSYYRIDEREEGKREIRYPAMGGMKNVYLCTCLQFLIYWPRLLFSLPPLSSCFCLWCLFFFNSFSFVPFLSTSLVFICFSFPLNFLIIFLLFILLFCLLIRSLCSHFPHFFSLFPFSFLLLHFPFPFSGRFSRCVLRLPPTGPSVFTILIYRPCFDAQGVAGLVNISHLRSRR